jgi:hypothetical protein
MGAAHAQLGYTAIARDTAIDRLAQTCIYLSQTCIYLRESIIARNSAAAAFSC